MNVIELNDRDRWLVMLALREKATADDGRAAGAADNAVASLDHLLLPIAPLPSVCPFPPHCIKLFKQLLFLRVVVGHRPPLDDRLI